MVCGGGRLTDSLLNNKIHLCQICEEVKGNLEASFRRPVRQFVNSHCMHGLPFQDLLPGLLIVLVVDFNDVGHIFCSEVIITPAPSAAQTKLTVKADREPPKNQQRVSTVYCLNTATK